MSAGEGRLARLLWALAAEEVGAAIITAPASVRWLCGYVGSNGIAVVGPDGGRLITDSRYAVSAREQVSGLDVVIGARDLSAAVAEAVRDVAGGSRVAVEAEHMTLARHRHLVEALPGVELVPVDSPVLELRAVKDAAEIAAVRRAAEIADRALARVLERPLLGRTEREVAFDLHGALIGAGAEGPSFPIIVAAGPNGARPHAEPGPDPIPPDTLVVIDLGAVHHGYCSDMTRTIVVGRPPAELARAYDVCAEAQRAALRAVRPGVGAAELDGVARGVIEDAGLGAAFGHGLGHGVGLDIHEAPGIRPNARGELREGMIITIEPGVYLEGLGGVRIEDLVLVTSDGAEVLSGAPLPRTIEEARAE